MSQPALRNVAIIAHVDHGKTTLVDLLFSSQSGTFRDNQRVEERAMDSNDLEKERGITILAKPTSVEWLGADGKREPTRVNIVDTPGHADFGGEVERILSMVDGVVLLVDASEGAMPQTKFVIGKALAPGSEADRGRQQGRPARRAHPGSARRGVRPVRGRSRPPTSSSDFPALFASGRHGWAGDASSKPSTKDTLTPLFETIVKHVPPPTVDRRSGVPLAGDDARGRQLPRPHPDRPRPVRLDSSPTQTIHALEPRRQGTSRPASPHPRAGVPRPRPCACSSRRAAGDIVAVAGLKVATVWPTPSAKPRAHRTDRARSRSIRRRSPCAFTVNDSPLAGRRRRQGHQPHDPRPADARRRRATSPSSVTDTENADSYEVAGRGELQLGVLIETMRREGFELAARPPARPVPDRPQDGPASGADRGSRDRRRRCLHRPRRRARSRCARASCRTCARRAPARPASCSTPPHAA